MEEKENTPQIATNEHDVTSQLSSTELIKAEDHLPSTEVASLDPMVIKEEE